MTQEDKELLIKDLCTRLPYGVKARAFADEREIYGYNITIYGITKDNVYDVNLDAENIEDIKPYLFPMSSMTEEQKNEYFVICHADFLNSMIQDVGVTTALYKGVDWLNAHHFDYRGLIDKGLAIDATNLNIY